MRISTFIRANTKPIISEWENFAQTLVPADGNISSLGLRDHIGPILSFIANDIESAQSEVQQEEKSRGEKPRGVSISAAEMHASLRHDGGFDMDQMVSEYRALRASVVKLWTAQRQSYTKTDIPDLIRFNESIDQALTESIRGYTEKLELSRNLFLSILGHDIRNPLGAISMSAQLMSRIGTFSDREKMLLAQITESTLRANEIVTHLLDLTRTRLGSGMPILKEPMNLGFVGRKIVDEIEVMHPKREFRIDTSGDLEGEWDKARLAQVLSNLLGNAVQYGFKTSPITVTVAGFTNEVSLSVHNEGNPIESRMAEKIFDSLTRGEVLESKMPVSESANLGLGLYISKQIIVAHGGNLSVTSSEKNGTTFIARFPR